MADVIKTTVLRIARRAKRTSRGVGSGPAREAMQAVQPQSGVMPLQHQIVRGSPESSGEISVRYAFDFHPTVDTTRPARISSIARFRNGRQESKAGLNGHLKGSMPAGEGNGI